MRVKTSIYHPHDEDIVSDEEKIHLGSLLHKLRLQMWTRMSEMKEKYPLVEDYLNSELKEVEKQFKEVHNQSPVTSEDEAMMFFNYRRIDKDLSKIEHGGFPYLWDENLYALMKKATDVNLGITNNWVKVLIASNLLELSLNQALINNDQDLFEKLKNQNASIIRKTEEINKILEKQNKEKLKRVDINFIKSHRIDADHPISDFIKELTSEDSMVLIEMVKDALERLKPLLDTKRYDPEFEAEIVEKGPIRSGDSFTTKIKFRGKLVGGFFDNRIEAPVGKTFPHGSEIWWCPDPYTAPGPMDKPGKLVGDGGWEATWICKIQNNFPIGKYKVNICVYDHLGEGNRPVIKEKTVTIDVVE